MSADTPNTSPTAPHSPTPWEIVSTETSRPRTRGWKEIRSGRSPVVDVDSFDVHSGGETETHCGVRISDANAALIVRAVNSHEGLVRCRDALRDVLEAWDMLDYPEDDGGYTIAKIDAVYSRARAALAEAGEE